MRCLLIAASVFVCLLSGQDPTRTLTAREAFDLAARMNPAVQLAAIKALESKTAAAIVSSAYRTQAAAVISFASQTNNLQAIGLSIPGFTDRLGPYRVFNARPAVTQTVVDLALLSRMRASSERAGAAELDSQARREEVQAAVLTLYLRVFQAESKWKAAQTRLEIADALLDQTGKLSSSGEGSRLDVARVRQQREGELLNVIHSREEREVLKAILLETIGLPATANVQLASPDPAVAALGTQEELLASSFATRPDLKALEASIRAAKQEEIAATRERLPRVSISADYGLLGAGPDRSLSTYTVGVGVTIPITTGGRIQAETKAAALRRSALEVELLRLKLATTRQIATAEIELEEQQQAFRAAGAGAAAARTTLELVRVRFGAGLATSLDVVTAQGQLAQADEAQIFARYGAMLARVDLAHASGDIGRYFE